MVAYDIGDDATRTRVHKCLSNFGQAVQRSVFECGGLTERRAALLRRRLGAFRLGDGDTICLYILCRECLGRIERIPPRRGGFDEVDLVV